MEGNLNRRSFVKGATLSAAGLIAGGALAACSPAAGTSESKSETAQTTGANNAEQRWSFEIAPVLSATTSSPKRLKPMSWWWEAA